MHPSFASRTLLSVVLAVVLVPSAIAFAQAKRTKAQVDALIEKKGKTKPDWWDKVRPKYPKTLDLSWKQPPPPPWDPQKNVGQFLWDIIYPNPGRWKEGARFVHFLAAKHQQNPVVFKRACGTLGMIYHRLLEDHARAAFWWKVSGDHPLGLAECYWKLGSKDAAVQMIKGYSHDPTRYGALVKLWADMGEIDRALNLAKAKTRSMPDVGNLVAGDACRIAGRNKEALAYYQKALAAPNGGRRKEDITRNKNRARANIEAIKLFNLLDLGKAPDGTYKNSSLGYAGMIEVAVTVKRHRLTGVKVTKHKEKQFYAALFDTPRQILAKQGFRGVDAVSGATMTSEAIINATAKALAGAMR